ncbi:MAG: type II toxin-antitoxin system VapC family toxin [Acidobacteria bacterium]|nr:type II toxin-antitoxin system VapC family toxin [Acidobacteriota bacterium]MBI1983906.1 type II toxin-antitoxin system VapC family toxin [Acidobacteriota bacterium]
MSRFVVDCSVTLAWCFENQADDYTRGVLTRLDRDEALVPSVWPLEVANALAVAERRKKLSRSTASRFVAALGPLPILVQQDTHLWALGPILTLARELHLSAYDAAYLELAIREGLSLATRDEALKKAARASRVELARG